MNAREKIAKIRKILEEHTNNRTIDGMSVLRCTIAEISKIVLLQTGRKSKAALHCSMDQIRANIFREFEGLSACPKSPSGKHQLKMVGFPNTEYWGDKMEQSIYDYVCHRCQEKFEIPYATVNKKK